MVNCILFIEITQILPKCCSVSSFFAVHLKRHIWSKVYLLTDYCTALLEYISIQSIVVCGTSLGYSYVWLCVRMFWWCLVWSCSMGLTYFSYWVWTFPKDSLKPEFCLRAICSVTGLIVRTKWSFGGVLQELWKRYTFGGFLRVEFLWVSVRLWRT